MERHCDECVFRKYEEQDYNEVWPFCACTDKDLRKKIAEYWNYAHRHSIRCGFEHNMNVFPEDKMPSCQLVQSAYSELYGCRCTHKQTNN